MKRLGFFVLVVLAGLVGSAHAGEKTKLGKVLRFDPQFDKLLPKDAEMEIIARGFKWTEGTVWVKNGGFLLFSDIPNNTVHKWKEGEGLTKDFVKPSGYTGKEARPGVKKTDEPGSNGLTVDPKGRLTLCEHGDRRVTVLDLKSKKKTVLADKFEGKRFNSPNDNVWHPNGDLYFTDPPYGLPGHGEDPAREMDYCGVYLLKKDGKLILLTKEMSRPNGIALSPDGKTLYVANSDPKLAYWKKFDVKSDGTVGPGKIFYDQTENVGKKPGLPDGLKVDVHGNLWATGAGGVLIFSPDGKLLGQLDTGVPTANCAFGDDGSTLYIAANNDIARIRTTTKGLLFKSSK